MKTYLAALGAGVLILAMLGALGIGNFDMYYGLKTFAQRCGAERTDQ